MFNTWKPEVFQGRGKKRDYFEGWYFKSIDGNEKIAYSIIPGISLSRDSDKSHAFIMLLDARNHKMYYFKYPVSDFWADKSKFEIKIHKNLFSLQKIKLDINEPQNEVKADLEFGNIIPWPVKLLSPGVMGPYAFIPKMECYHGVLSFDHQINGFVEINGDKKDFNGGKGYMEKDWGTSMPSSWIWMQTNHFEEDGISLFGSIANIPWLRNYFTGYIFGLLYEGNIYRFTKYNGAKINELVVDNDKIHVKIENKSYILEINAKRAEGVDLPAPSLGEMTSKVNESLKSRIKLEFYRKSKHKNELIFSGTGRNAGLEFVGDIKELLSGLKK
ncbi:MAG: tocopherol cyclase family protein [Methanobacterium sp.]